MISTFRAGQVAGSTVSCEYSQYTLEEQRQVAHTTLEQRKQLRVAHWIPEEEFIQGFLHGYQHLASVIDGLQVFVALHSL